MNRRRLLWWVGCCVVGALWSLPKTFRQIADAEDPTRIALSTFSRFSFGWLLAVVVVEVVLRVYFARADRKRRMGATEQ